jgi:hypothetical protein
VMTPEQLRELPASEALNLRPLLRALWIDQQGNWEGAHEVAQEVESRDGCWLHAYLHRKEGDTSNAAYWYRRAGKPLFMGSLDEEWRSLAISFLAA